MKAAALLVFVAAFVAASPLPDELVPEVTPSTVPEAAPVPDPNAAAATPAPEANAAATPAPEMSPTEQNAEVPEDPANVETPDPGVPAGTAEATTPEEPAMTDAPQPPTNEEEKLPTPEMGKEESKSEACLIYDISAGGQPRTVEQKIVMWRMMFPFPPLADATKVTLENKGTAQVQCLLMGGDEWKVLDQTPLSAEHEFQRSYNTPAVRGVLCTEKEAPEQQASEQQASEQQASEQQASGQQASGQQASEQ